MSFKYIICEESSFGFFFFFGGGSIFFFFRWEGRDISVLFIYKITVDFVFFFSFMEACFPSKTLFTG